MVVDICQIASEKKLVVVFIEENRGFQKRPAVEREHALEIEYVQVSYHHETREKRFYLDDTGAGVFTMEDAQPNTRTKRMRTPRDDARSLWNGLVGLGFMEVSDKNNT